MFNNQISLEDFKNYLSQKKEDWLNYSIRGSYKLDYTMSGKFRITFNGRIFHEYSGNMAMEFAVKEFNTYIK